ncbi:MAG: YitT family protein, partial [Clostridiales bacterium]|nr:YitT family protein [Clostridiales bacterium]
MKEFLKSQLIIVTGITLTAIATGLFYLPNEIVTGGVSGIATILYQLGIPPGAVYLILNIVLLALSYRILGKRFVLNSVFSVIVLSVLVQVFSQMPPVTDDLFLASFFGSCLFGTGAAMTFASGANTGGTDIIGRLIQSKYPYFPIGLLLLIIDGIIILISLFVFKNIKLALYGLFGLIASSIIIDFFIDRLNASKLAFVITDKGEQISKMIIENSRRGVTVLNARGA